MKWKLAFAFLFISTFSQAQACLEGGIHFASQESINQFPVLYPGCTQIKGNLSMSGLDIKDLSPLNQITKIDGNLWIYFNPSLERLKGLGNVKFVGGFLEIQNMDILISLDYLNAIESVGAQLRISENFLIKNLDGLKSIDRKSVV